MQLEPNPGKSLTIEIGGSAYARYPIKTHVIKPDDVIAEVVRQYAAPHVQPGDVLCISEKAVGITQGRAFPIADIRPGKMARLLCKFVKKTKHGIGLGSPETMQLAIQEVGLPRILLAAIAAAITKPFGIKGVFYHVAGRQAAAIDGPTPYTLPPYNRYASLAPKQPEKTAKELASVIGVPVAIIDANDLGVEVLGASKGVDRELIRAAFKDNPLGQGSEQTPMAVVRKV
jgi:F420-0:gamma-glutamyl ligase-like protein